MPEQNDPRLTQIPTERSLVATTPVRSDPEAGAGGQASPRPEAAFLVQLMACRDGLAPYRRHRRESPDIAARRYASAGALPVRTLRRA
jgi:hypothetical protein